MCEFLFVLERGEKVTKEKEEKSSDEGLKERCVGISSLSVSKRGMCVCAPVTAIYMISGKSKQCMP